VSTSPLDTYLDRTRIKAQNSTMARKAFLRDEITRTWGFENIGFREQRFPEPSFSRTKVFQNTGFAERRFLQNKGAPAKVFQNKANRTQQR
jgi:hypothetical protein